MSPGYVRLCPACGIENAADSMRCACGAMLLAVDLTEPRGPSVVIATESRAAPHAAAVTTGAGVRCPFEDCRQTSPAGALRCVYCDRPTGVLDGDAVDPQAIAGVLPSALSLQYRLVRALPTQGAEADLFLIAAIEDGQQRVAKVYRTGLTRNAEVAERVTEIDARYRLEMFAAGSSDGRAYEVLEFCQHGSLRDLLARGRPDASSLFDIVVELDAAIAAVHATKLVHRDIKPENVLVRSATPLQLVLIDFNIASVLDATQRFTGTARTLHYAAPEALSGVIDGKTDYWAMGMVVLETVLGRHPFAGLSEAVILHQLATRSIDVAAVDDKAIKQLLRGLLRRDPATRWGHAEIVRWLARDLTLPEPAEESLDASFREPYHLGGENCRTPAQLALALARHWKEGVADLNNGQLLSWFSNVQKDQDTVRLLIDFQQDAQLHGDVRLLRLLLHLYPAIPPTWRGESIELPALLARANASLAGDESASRWLDDLYQRAVLHVYASAGNAEAQSIEQHWGGAMTRFETAWESSLATLKHVTPESEISRAHSIDDKIYGQQDEQRADYRTLHAKLIASSYDNTWIANLREHLRLALTNVVIQHPALASLGDPATIDAPALLVLDALLPGIQLAAQQAVASNAAQAQQRHGELEQMDSQAKGLIAHIRSAARQSTLNRATCIELRDQLDQYFSLRSRIQLAGVSDAMALNVRKTLMRFEPTAQRLLIEVDALDEHLLENSGWLDERVLSFMLLAIIIVPAVLSARTLYLMTPLVIAIAAWRLLPIHLIRRRIRGLASIGSVT